MDYLTKYYKNLSEQLQEKVNHLQKLLNENAPDATGMHSKIVDSIVKHHASAYPHKRVGDHSKNIEASAAHIKEILNKHPEAPFTDPEKAIKAIHPHAIEANYDLEARIYDTRPDAAMGGDISELPQGEYEELTQENEEDYAEELHGKVMKDIGG